MKKLLILDAGAAETMASNRSECTSEFPRTNDRSTFSTPMMLSAPIDGSVADGSVAHFEVEPQHGKYFIEIPEGTQIILI